MFFSESMPFKTFLEKYFKRDQGYRLTLDTRDNTCNYTYLENVRVPNFNDSLGFDIDMFSDIIENRKWSWLLCSRFKYFYVYIIEGRIYLCDRDNIKVKNFLNDHMRLDKEAEESSLPQHKWMMDKIAT